MKEIEYTMALSKFRAHIKKFYATQREAAIDYGIGPSFLSEVLNNKRNIKMTEQMLDDVGMRWVRIITKKSKSGNEE